MKITTDGNSIIIRSGKPDLNEITETAIQVSQDEDVILSAKTALMEFRREKQEEDLDNARRQFEYFKVIFPDLIEVAPWRYSLGGVNCRNWYEMRVNCTIGKVGLITDEGWAFYSMAGFGYVLERMEEMRKYENLPWYKKIFVDKPRFGNYNAF